MRGQVARCRLAEQVVRPACRADLLQRPRPGGGAPAPLRGAGHWP